MVRGSIGEGGGEMKEKAWRRALKKCREDARRELARMLWFLRRAKKPEF